MSTEKMRGSFKAWAMTTGFEEHHFALRDDGEFKDYDVRRLWGPWQASRAAIEVELPGRMEFAEKGGDYFDGARNGYNQCLDACAISLKFSGLTVKS